MAPADGRVLDDRYRLDRWVASGGFGEVWQATDVVLGRPVAVKLLRADRAADPQVIARFRLEARRASSVTHQNTARIFDYNDEAAGQPPFLVMEFVKGQSLSDLLADGPLVVPTTLGIVAQVAAGMDAAHKAGLFHLDVKPANVLLSADGAVKITDFGIGTTGTEHASEGIGCLTPAYLAPECVIGERGTPAADLYSLGVLAHECLRGEPPFTGTPLQVAVAHQVRDLPPLPASVPAAVTALIMELTDKDPEGRPGSAAEVAMRASALREQFAPQPPARHPVAPAAWLPAAQTHTAQTSAARMPAVQALARRSWRGRFLIVPVAAVAVSALLLAGRAGESKLPVQNEVPARHATVRVDGAAFKNLPVSVVDRRLRRMGFLVRTRWRRSASVPAGLVIAVRPTGQLPLGSVVTVLGSGPAGGSGRMTLGRPARNHHRQSKHKPHDGPTGTPSHSPKASSSASPHPTPTASPSPTGTPSPTPSQSPASSPTPSGSPGGS